jgi:hypothetical protein
MDMIGRSFGSNRMTPGPRLLGELRRRRAILADTSCWHHRVGADLELHADDRAALERGRADLADPLHGVERLLDRARHLALDDVGARAGIGGLGDDDG